MAHSAASNLKRVVTQRGKNSLEIERDKFESGQVVLVCLRHWPTYKLLAIQLVQTYQQFNRRLNSILIKIRMQVLISFGDFKT